MQLETRTYQKEHNKSLVNYLKESLADVYNSRYLAKQLAVRDIKAQYRQSYLGILWAFIMPLTTAFVWVFLNGSGTVKLTDTGVAYPLFAFTGTLIWSMLNDAINAPIQNTLAAKGILSKINFPKEALIISGIYKLLFNSSVKLVLLLFFLVFYGVGFKLSLVWLPIVLLGVLCVGTTLGLLITPLGMLYKDVAKVVNMGLSLVMYVTPVVYVVPKESGVMRTLMHLNPFTPLIVTVKNMAFGTSPEYLIPYLVIVLCCLPLGALALLFYRMSIPVIVERMSA
ncbi:MAG: ABC transporter permease [Flavobacteriaceae bacterium]